MIGLTDKTRDIENINREALVLGLTYTLTPKEKLDRIRRAILDYEKRYDEPFEVGKSLEVTRVLLHNC